jgi:hypothetical protein
MALGRGGFFHILCLYVEIIEIFLWNVLGNTDDSSK